MKKYLAMAVLVIGISLVAGDKVRQFDAGGKPLAAGKTGAYSLVCKSEQEWNDSGCPDNLKLENGKIRLKTAEEKKAESDAAKALADAKAKTEHEKSSLGILEKRVEALEAEIEKLKKK